MQCHAECQALPHSAVPSLFIRQWLYAKTYLIFAWLFRGSWDTITVKKKKKMFQGRCLSQLEPLQQNTIDCLTVLEAGSLRSGHQQGGVLVRACFPAGRWQHSLHSHMVKRKRGELLGVSSYCSSAPHSCPTLCHPSTATCPGFPFLCHLLEMYNSNRNVSDSLSQWCYPTISSSVIPLSSCLQSFPESKSFLMSWLVASGGQNIRIPT